MLPSELGRGTLHHGEIGGVRAGRPGISFNAFDKHIHGMFGVIIRMRIDGGQRRHRVLGFRHIVEADELHIGRHSQPTPLQFVNSTERDGIVETQHRLRARQRIQHGCRGLHTAMLIPAEQRNDIPSIHGQTALFMSMHIPLDTQRLRAVALIANVLPTMHVG